VFEEVKREKYKKGENNSPPRRRGAKRPLTGFTGLTGKQQAKGKTGAVSILLILSKSSVLRAFSASSKVNIIRRRDAEGQKDL
jgi:hypothetical protein